MDLTLTVFELWAFEIRPQIRAKRETPPSPPLSFPSSSPSPPSPPPPSYQAFKSRRALVFVSRRREKVRHDV